MKKVLSWNPDWTSDARVVRGGTEACPHSGRRRPTSARRVLYWVDPMHPDYKSDHAGVAPDCGMQLEPVYAESIAASGSSAAPIPPGMVGIDAEKQQLFGIRVSAVERSSGTENVRVLGRVVPEDTRVYRLNAGMEGFIRETFNDSPGELVKKNQKLATYYGGDILAVASGFLAATAGVPGANGKDGSRTVPFPGAVSKQGSSSVQGYTDRLRNLGMSDAQIQEMAETRLLPESINVVSPVDGFVLARNISPGQHFEHSTEFYRIADLSRVWIVADILGNEAQHFRPGTAVRVVLVGGREGLDRAGEQCASAGGSRHADAETSLGSRESRLRSAAGHVRGRRVADRETSGTDGSSRCSH